MLRALHYSETPFRYWWISLLVGLLSLGAGVCCFATPIGSLTALTVFFLTVLLAGGIFNIIFALSNIRENGLWGWSLARGILELLFGLWLVLFPLPLLTTLLIYLIGVWMLFHSILGICESCAVSAFPVRGWGWLLACNILSLLCAFLFLTLPAFGGVFVLVYIGLSFLLYGVFRIALAFHLRRINRASDSFGGDAEVEDAEVVDGD